MTEPKAAPMYLKYFSAILENQSVSQLPQELQSCGDCGNQHDTYHALVAGPRGRKKGIEGVCVVNCQSCGSVHLTQLFTRNYRGRGMDAPILRAIAKDMGFKAGPSREAWHWPQPDA